MTLTELYAGHKRSLTSKLYPYTHNLDTAEDLVQDAFVRALVCFDQYDASKSSLKTWFTKIMFSCLWNKLREIRKTPTTFDISDVVESEFLAYEDTPSLAPYIDAVKNSTHKAVLAGYFIFGYTPNEVAKLLGVERANVRKIVQRFQESQK